jgi:hypothetical protein
MKFTELKFTSKIKACKDYKKQWEETHKKNDLSLDEIYTILFENKDDDYEYDGEFIE